LTKFDYYLYRDHSARSKTTFLAVAIGAGTGMLSESLGSSPTLAAALCVSVIGIVEIVRASRYVQPKKLRHVALDLPSTARRSLILVPVSVLLFMVLAFLPVPRIEAAVIERKLKENAEHPYDSQSMREASRTLLHAEVEKINLRPAVVESTGKKFLGVAASDPDAWNTAIACLNYKSFLNVSLTIQSTDVLPVGTRLTTEYTTHWPTGGKEATFSVAGSVPRDRAAQCTEIGKPDPNASVAFGNDWIVVRDGDFTLDNMLLKKMICRKVQIFYAGGPLIMHQVYFLGCTFTIEQTPNGQGFVLAGLKPSPATDFEGS
jgi:hypothetical protein